MELNWSTFVLELVNFLVLVWILKRFLYEPVLGVISRRRAAIDQTLADAKRLETESKNLQQKYESRLADWESERRQAQEALMRELDDERGKRLGELHEELEQARQGAEVAEARRLDDLRRQIEQTTLVQGARFATRLLQQAAGPELQARLFDQFLTDLATLPAELRSALIGNVEDRQKEIVATSAYPLSDDERTRLREALDQATKLELPIRYEQDPALLSGLRLTTGAWVLGLNLQDELKGFARLTDGNSTSA